MRGTSIRTLLATVALASSPFAMGDESPDPSEVHINGISYGGPGCPAGSVGEYLSDDAKAFTLAFDEFSVEKGPGIPLSESRKFCNVNLDLHIPQGWQYSVFKVDYRGFADLPRGTYGIQQSTYRFSGSAGRRSQVKLRTLLRGSFSDDYEINDTLGVTSLVWSPCGVNRALNIKAEARLGGNRRLNSFMTVDTIDGEFKTIYKLQWRRCWAH
jgi:hypothetical protein